MTPVPRKVALIGGSFFRAVYRNAPKDPLGRYHGCWVGAKRSAAVRRYFSALGLKHARSGKFDVTWGHGDEFTTLTIRRID